MQSPKVPYRKVLNKNRDIPIASSFPPWNITSLCPVCRFPQFSVIKLPNHLKNPTIVFDPYFNKTELVSKLNNMEKIMNSDRNNITNNLMIKRNISIHLILEIPIAYMSKKVSRNNLI